MTLAWPPETLCAAYLADRLREPPQPLPWQQCDPAALVQVLQQNKVPLLSLRNPDACPQLLSDPAFESALSDEKLHWTALEREYGLVRDAMGAARIEDALIKSVGLAPSFPYRSDNLDVLYRPEDVPRVKSTLEGLGYVELKNVEEPHKFLFFRFHGGQLASAIHVHAHVGWMVSFLDEAAAWPRRRLSADDGLVTLLAPEDALLTALAHFFYEDKRLSLGDVCKLAHCLRQGIRWDEVFRVAEMRGWSDGLAASLYLCAYQECALYGATLIPPEVLRQVGRWLPGWARRQWSARWGARAVEMLLQGASPDVSPLLRESPLGIPFAFSKAFFYAKLVRDPSRTRARRAKDLAVHTANGTKLRLHIHSQPAMLVALSGVDGCGKTTQARALESSLERCNLRVRTVWTRGGSSSWIGWLTRFSKRTAFANTAATSAGADERLRERQRRFQSPMMRAAWTWLTTLELLALYFRKIAVPLWRGRIVIADRYVADALADRAANMGDGSVIESAAARLLRWLSPRPAFAYWLDVSPETARLRSKDGMPTEFIAVQRAAYTRQTAASLLQRVDGERPWEEVSDSLVQGVLRHYFAHYHTLVNSLFLKNPGQWT